MKETLELLYYLSGIILAIGVIVCIKQLRVAKDEIKLLNQDYKTKNERAAIESSLKYLEVAKTIIRDMSDYQTKFSKEVSKRADTKHLFNKDFLFESLDDILKEKELVVDLLVSEKMGVTHIFNELEVFSVAMLNGVADEDIVFTPFGKVFCTFIEEEHLRLSFSRTTGTPYENLVKLYNVWSDRIEVQVYELQKREAEDKIKSKGNNYDTRTPIGL